MPAVPPPANQPRKIKWKHIVSVIVALIAAGGVIISAIITRQQPQVPTITPTATAATPYVDFSGSSHSRQWTINGNTIVSDGSAPCCNQSDIVLVAPSPIPTTKNYAVEAQIQETGINLNQPQHSLFFGFLIRGSEAGPIGYNAYFVEIVGSTNQAETATILIVNPPNYHMIKSGPVDSLGSAQHSYRVEVKGSVITLTIDGKMWLSASDPDNTYPNGTTIGLVDSGCQLQIQNFKVSQF